MFATQAGTKLSQALVLSAVCATPDARMLALVPDPNDARGEPDDPRYSTSSQMSSLFGNAAAFQMPWTVQTRFVPVTEFHSPIWKDSKGWNHATLAVVTIFQDMPVVPSLAPPVRMIVVSTVCVPSNG